MGSVAYCAPEQIRGDPIGERADLYSLGCMLFECLTGHPPYPRENEVASMYAHLEEPPPRPSDHGAAVPPALDAVVATAMAKRPSDRYASAEKMVSAMRAAVAPGAEPARRRRRPGAVIGAAAAAVILVLTIAVMLTRGSGDADTPPSSPSPSIARAFEQGLLVVDPTTGEESARYPGTFGTSAFIADDLLAAGNGAIWTTDDLAQVLRVDPATGEPTALPPAGCTLDAITTGLGSTWIVCPGSTLGTVLEVDPFDLTSREIPMPGNLGATTGVGAARGTLWIAASGFLVRVDQLGRRAELVEGVTADDVAVDQHGVWVVDELASTVTRIDPATGQPGRAVEVPGAIDDVAAGSGSLWVLDGNAGTVTRIDPATGEIDDPIGVGPGASSVRLGFGAVWVCVPDELRLVRIDPVTEATSTLDVGAPARVAVADPARGGLWLLV
jgi:streptogramin lyase